MSRLDSENYSSAAREYLAGFHSDVVSEVSSTVATHPVVVVGMATNPFVKKIRKRLAAEKIEYTYLGYGGYMSKWKQRLAVKLWSGWPTFPQVFVNGVLIGGNDRAQQAIDSGLFRELLEKGRG